MKTSGPAHPFRLRDRPIERNELALHPMPERPERLGQTNRLALGPRPVGLGDDDDLRAEFRHVGERVADHDAGGERLPLPLQQLRLADQVAVAAGAGDQLVAADQGRDRHARDHRRQSPIDDLQQQFRGTPAGIGEIDMRVGVVDGQAVHLPQHAVGEDAVQVERDDDRHRGAGDRADALQEIALRIELAIGAHRAVQGHVNRVHLPDPGGDRVQQFRGKPCPALGGEQAGTAGAGAAGGHDPHVGTALEHRQRAADGGVEPALPQQFLAPLHVEVAVIGRHRIE